MIIKTLDYMRRGNMLLQPYNFELEKTTVWAFPDRGNWATHVGDYRGNWTPYVPRNLIMRYSKEGDWILDQFVGSGTTLVEAKLLNRNAIGIDINPEAIYLTKERLGFNCKGDSRLVVREGNAEHLDFLKDEEIDFICTHPPYANIIKYSEGIEGDISYLEINDFMESMKLVAKESYRVLKPEKICAVMMGDVRKSGKVIPLGFKVMEVFLSAGFKSKEIIIKEQFNCRSSKYWTTKKNSFLLLAHEYIFIFEK